MLCDDYQGIFGTKTDTQGTAVIDWVIGVVSCVNLSCHDVAVVNFLKQFCKEIRILTRAVVELIKKHCACTLC